MTCHKILAHPQDTRCAITFIETLWLPPYGITDLPPYSPSAVSLLRRYPRTPAISPGKTTVTTPDRTPLTTTPRHTTH